MGSNPTPSRMSKDYDRIFIVCITVYFDCVSFGGSRGTWIFCWNENA